MEGMGARKIINRESKVKFIVAQIVRLLSVFEPGQLELVRRSTVAEKDEDETPIRCFFPSCCGSMNLQGTSEVDRALMRSSTNATTRSHRGAWN